jgi:hypothetical protein
MKPCLRETLAQSHVAVAVIAILIFWFITSIFEAFWPWIAHAGQFLFTAVAIFDIPYFSPTSTLIMSGFYVYSAVLSLSTAWLLARWIYAEGPLQVLAIYHERLTRGMNV